MIYFLIIVYLCLQEHGLVYVESAEGKGSLVTPEAKNILEREEGSLGMY